MAQEIENGRYRIINLVLLTAMASLTLAALLLVPALLLPRDPRWGLLLVPVALLTNGFAEEQLAVAIAGVVALLEQEANDVFLFLHVGV